jgi:hypothetical protein
MKIPDDIDRRLDAMARNDPDEAESIARAFLYAVGYIPAATAHYLFMLQDDDADLRRRLIGLNIKPEPGVAEVQ